MKRFLRWSIAFVVLFLVAAAIAFLCRDIVLKRLAERRIQERTGLRAQIGSLKSGVRSRSFLLRNVKLYSRADFGGFLLLDMPEFFVEVDAQAAAAGRLHLRELRLRVDELNIIRDERGLFNVDQIESDFFAGDSAGVRTNSVPRARSFEFAGIDLLLLTISRVTFSDRRNPSLNFDIDVGLKDERFANLKSDVEIGSKLFRLIITVAMKARKPGKGGRVEVFFDPDDDAPTNTALPATPSP